MLYVLLDTAIKEDSFSWPIASTIIGTLVIVVEAFIRIYIHNSKNTKTKKEETNNVLTDAEVAYLKNLSQNVMNNHNNINELKFKLESLEDTVDDLKSLIRDVEKDNFSALSNVVDKIDVLKNILLEAKMNSKK